MKNLQSQRNATEANAEESRARAKNINADTALKEIDRQYRDELNSLEVRLKNKDIDQKGYNIVKTMLENRMALRKNMLDSILFNTSIGQAQATYAQTRLNLLRTNAEIARIEQYTRESGSRTARNIQDWQYYNVFDSAGAERGNWSAARQQSSFNMHREGYNNAKGFWNKAKHFIPYAVGNLLEGASDFYLRYNPLRYLR